MPMSLRDYVLAKPGDVPTNVKDTYKVGSFDTLMRDWHLERLPRFIIPSGTYITCPYCGKSKDRRSMQIDHIIPQRVYARYRLYQKIVMLKAALDGDDPESSMNAISWLKAYYNELDNLLLSCMKCNSKKSDKFLETTDYDAAYLRAGTSDLEARLKKNATIYKEIETLGNKHGVDVKKFVKEGADWNTSRMTLRDRKPTGNPHKMTTAKKYTKQYKSVSTDETFSNLLTGINNLVISYLTTGRVAWTVTIGQLEALQPTTKFSNEEGRLCFYCLGLFKKQAFQIDHINPSFNRNESEQSYNNPLNLIPVCRTCNTSKGERPLSTAWCEERTKARSDEKLPGLELIDADHGQQINQTVAEYAIERRKILVGC